MAIVCTRKKTTRIRVREIICQAMAAVLFAPVVSFAAKPPTAAQCNGALIFVSETQQLNFGAMLGGTAGTVTVDYKGTASSTGPVLLTTPIPQAGVLNFSTTSPAPGYDCSNLSPVVAFTDGILSNGTSTMTVTNFTYSTKTGNPFTKFNTGTYYIGGDLIVNGTETSGAYSTTNAGGVPYGITLTFQ